MADRIFNRLAIAHAALLLALAAVFAAADERPAQAKTTAAVPSQNLASNELTTPEILQHP